jgi:hypothetical protein
VVRLTQAPAVFFWTYPMRGGRGPFETGVSVADMSVDGIDFGLKVLERNRVRFQGNVWVDAQPGIGTDIRAIVNGVDCTAGTGSQLFATVLPSNRYEITVLSSEYTAGCGREGDAIELLVDGQPAVPTRDQVTTEAPVWSPDSQAPFLHLVVGTPLSTFEALHVGLDADGDLNPEPRPGAVVEAYIGDTLCGRMVMRSVPVDFLSVASSQLTPGCAIDGSPISFRVDGVGVTAVTFTNFSGRHRGQAEPWLAGVRGTSTILQAPLSRIAPPTVGSEGLK